MRKLSEQFSGLGLNWSTSSEIVNRMLIIVFSIFNIVFTTLLAFGFAILNSSNLLSLLLIILLGFISAFVICLFIIIPVIKVTNARWLKFWIIFNLVLNILFAFMLLIISLIVIVHFKKINIFIIFAIIGLIFGFFIIFLGFIFLLLEIRIQWEMRKKIELKNDIKYYNSRVKIIDALNQKKT